MCSNELTVFDCTVKALPLSCNVVLVLLTVVKMTVKTVKTVNNGMAMPLTLCAHLQAVDWFQPLQLLALGVGGLSFQIIIFYVLLSLLSVVNALFVDVVE